MTRSGPGAGGSPDLAAFAQINSISIAVDQRVWIAGEHAGPLTLGGQTLSPPSSERFVAAVTPDGDVTTAAALESSMPLPQQLTVGDFTIAAEPSGALVLAARVAGTLSIGGGVVSSPADGAMLLAKLDPAAGLTPVWSRVVGSGLTDDVDGTGQSPVVVRVGSCGDLLLTGWFSGTLDLGCGAMTAATAPDPQSWGDLFFAKLGP